jgi:HIT domain
MAFRDVRPVAPSHFLVIPKNRMGLTGMRKATKGHIALLGHLMYVASYVARWLMIFAKDCHIISNLSMISPAIHHIITSPDKVLINCTSHMKGIFAINHITFYFETLMIMIITISACFVFFRILSKILSISLDCILFCKIFIVKIWFPQNAHRMDPIKKEMCRGNLCQYSFEIGAQPTSDGCRLLILSCF